MIQRLLIFSLLIFSTISFGALSKTKQEKKRKATKKADVLRSKDSDTSAANANQTTNSLRFSIGAGIQSIYLPSLGIDALISRGNLQVGGELGFFQISQAEFRGSTSFIGVTARWQISRERPFFVGASFGSRNISLTTSADLSFTDGNTGSTTTTNVAWTRNVSQTLFYPKAGWLWSWDKSALVAAGGLMIPLGSKATVSGSPPSADGISSEDYDATANSKLKDVTKTTNAVLPGLELKYLRFIN
jgi:hypothetical protein